MANCLPFNSINGDRVYQAEDWAWYFSTFIGNGVFPNPSNGLQVVVNSGMAISVTAGFGFINGYAYNNQSDYAITLDTADGSLSRIDRIVLRLDLVNREMRVAVLKGTVSSNPVAVDLVRGEEIYDLVLADVLVNKGVTSITSIAITDQRFNSEVCGIVAGTIEEIDASVLTVQFNDYFITYKSQMENEFGAWFEEMKDQLSEDAAGNLQNQIDELEEEIEAITNEEIDDLFEVEVSEDV